QDYTPEGFRWIEANDNDQSVFTYMRFAKDERDFLLIACNFTPVPRLSYRVGVPKAGHYRELLNSDSTVYGGSHCGNDGGRAAGPYGWQTYPYSLDLSIPPLGMVILKWEG